MSLSDLSGNPVKRLTEASVEILSQSRLVLTSLLIILLCFVVHTSYD